eukprot:2120016-Pyramimonas_sp.AAC.1
MPAVAQLAAPRKGGYVILLSWMGPHSTGPPRSPPKCRQLHSWQKLPAPKRKGRRQVGDG